MSDPLEFSPNDLRAIAGLSYRQINDWASRGALPSSRTGRRGWRRFSADQAFAIAISACLRRSVGLSLEQIAWLVGELTRQSAILEYALHLLDFEQELGVPVVTSNLVTFGLISGSREAAERVASLEQGGGLVVSMPVDKIAVNVQQQAQMAMRRLDESL